MANYCLRISVLSYVLLACCLLTGAQTTDPCNDYVTFNDPTRSVDYQLTSSDVPICDQYSITDGFWYRFVSNVGGKIPEFCVDVNQCGTQYPMWIQDTHPTDDTIKNVKVCLSVGADSDCCTDQWTENINIKRCEDNGQEYFVYQLKPAPSCSIAYCAGSGEPCPTGQVSVSGIGCTDQCPALAELPALTGPHLTYHEGLVPERFHFECHAAPGPIEFASYSVQFKFDGEDIADPSLFPVEEVIVNGSDPVAVLYDYQLRGRLGKLISCTVQPFYTDIGNTGVCDKKNSDNSYWAGIRPHTSSIQLHAYGQESFNVVFESTIPVFCPNTTAWSTQCAMSFALSMDAIDSGTQTCARSVSNERWTGSSEHRWWWEMQSDSDSQSVLPVKASEDDFRREEFVTYITFSPINLFFTLTNSLPGQALALYPIYNGYHIEDIPVHIYGDVSSTGYCSSGGDPYVNQFGHGWFPTFAIGDFRYVYSLDESLVFEIQIRQQPCSSGVTDISCNCAVAVREGNSVLGIDMCQRPQGQESPNFIRYLGGDSALGAGIYESYPDNWRIAMPSGAYVDVYNNDWSDRSLLDISISTPGRFHGKLDGVCGGNSSDDNDMYWYWYYDYQEDISSIMEEFRIPQAESFFAGPPECVSGVEEAVILCQCNATTENTGIGSTNNELICESQGKKIPLRSPGYVCDPSGGRKKRSTEDVGDDYIDDEDLYSVALEGPGRPTPLVMVWQEGRNIDEAKAIELCNGIYQNSPSFESCEEFVNLTQLMTECLTDIYLMDDASLLQSKERTMQNSCVASMKSQIVLGANDTASDSPALILLNSIVSAICPNMCSGHGSCENSRCLCSADYTGDDCSIDKTVPPTIKAVKGQGKCNRAERPCQHIRLEVKGVFKNPDLSCRYSGRNMMLEEGLSTVSHTVMANYSSSMEIICPMPPLTAHSSQTMSAAFIYQVSASNDGVIFSEEAELAVFHGSCVSCETADGEHSCSLMDGYCTIDGNCYQEGAISPYYSCQKCDSASDKFGWTGVSGCSLTTTTSSSISAPGVTTKPSDQDKADDDNKSLENDKLGTWELWSVWGSCDKPCDFALKYRKRSCVGGKCSGAGIEAGLCEQQPCSANVDEDRFSLGMDVNSTDIRGVLENTVNMMTEMAIAVNRFCSDKVSECCTLSGFDPKGQNGGQDITLSEKEDFRIIDGFPLLSENGLTKIKTVGLYAQSAMDMLCGGANRQRRDLNDKKDYLQPELLQRATQYSKDSIERALGATIVTINYQSQDTEKESDNWIYYLMGGLIALLVCTAVIVIVIYLKICKSPQKNKLIQGKEKFADTDSDQSIYNIYTMAPPPKVVFPGDKKRPLSPMEQTTPSSRPSSAGAIVIQTGLGDVNPQDETLPPLVS